MGTIEPGQPNGAAHGLPKEVRATAASDLVQRLDLPEEVTTQQAATILGCCKHTVLQYLADGLLEWRDVAPPSSNRPVFRLTLRSVLELRLAYRRDNPHPPRPAERPKGRQPRPPSSDFKPKHLRRKKSNSSESSLAPEE
jgi:hypothetical protein